MRPRRNALPPTRRWIARSEKRPTYWAMLVASGVGSMAWLSAMGCYGLGRNVRDVRVFVRRRLKRGFAPARVAIQIRELTCPERRVREVMTDRCTAPTRRVRFRGANAAS